MAALAISVTAALGWAVKTQLDTELGSKGLGALLNALSGALLDAYDNLAVVVLALTIGLFAGALISSGARLIDSRIKAEVRWGFRLLKREVAFARMIHKRPWLAFLAQDAHEDMRRLSMQLASRGLPEIPSFDPADRRTCRQVQAYLDLIHPHLTEDEIEYAVMCADKYRAACDHAYSDLPRPGGAPILIEDSPVIPGPDPVVPAATAGHRDAASASITPAKSHLGGRRSRRRR